MIPSKTTPVETLRAMAKRGPHNYLAINELADQVIAYREALDKIVADDNCDPVQVAHEAITPYTPWRKATSEEEAAVDDALGIKRSAGDTHLE